MIGSPPETGSRAVGAISWPGLVQGGMNGALIRYRLMAFIVGTALIVLVFVAIPLQYGANIKWVAEVVAPIHGYLYLVYLAAGADLARRAHWRLGRILLVVAAGFVPFLAFIIEHRVYRQVLDEWGTDEASRSGSVVTTGVGPDGGAPPIISPTDEA
jgi:integral membrane protein